jgi:chemosensory pili system protein ChpA (sensor histidine kinase/response regulator)
MSDPPLVMIVDDDEQIREALRDVLEHEGFAVVEAANGHEALTYLTTHPPPAVVLFDLSMPVMDGWELAQRLRSDARTAGIPMIVLTARGSHWGYPTDRVLRKPFDVRQLLDTLRPFTGGSATRH